MRCGACVHLLLILWFAGLNADFNHRIMECRIGNNSSLWLCVGIQLKIPFGNRKLCCSIFHTVMDGRFHTLWSLWWLKVFGMCLHYYDWGNIFWLKVVKGHPVVSLVNIAVLWVKNNLWMCWIYSILQNLLGGVGGWGADWALVIGLPAIHSHIFLFAAFTQGEVRKMKV